MRPTTSITTTPRLTQMSSGARTLGSLPAVDGRGSCGVDHGHADRREHDRGDEDHRCPARGARGGAPDRRQPLVSGNAFRPGAASTGVAPRRASARGSCRVRCGAQPDACGPRGRAVRRRSRRYPHAALAGAARLADGRIAYRVLEGTPACLVVTEHVEAGGGRVTAARSPSRPGPGDAPRSSRAIRSARRPPPPCWSRRLGAAEAGGPERRAQLGPALADEHRRRRTLRHDARQSVHVEALRAAARDEHDGSGEAPQRRDDRVRLGALEVVHVAHAGRAPRPPRGGAPPPRSPSTPAPDGAEVDAQQQPRRDGGRRVGHAVPSGSGTASRGMTRPDRNGHGPSSTGTPYATSQPSSTPTPPLAGAVRR